MKRIVVIPARHGSQRLPGKPLLRSTGKYLIQHVYERACQSRADRVVVATDDPRIRAAVEGFGGEVAMTRRDHPSGTDRVAEVANNIDADVIVNLQGDEPMVEPAAIDLLFGLLEKEPNADLATLATPLRSIEQWRNPNCVKVVCDRLGRALYFSRSPVPYVRDGEPDFGKSPGEFLLHLGLYAYRRPVLFRLAAAAPEPLETFEKLEQLRALALGYRIHVGRVETAAGGVDTFEDYQRFVEQYRQSTEPTNIQAA
jgi:3-deoxy-manno-octulosonate cytidylyltransferase (CMP-KDO synthetase)